jgi:hypothetical protein
MMSKQPGKVEDRKCTVCRNSSAAGIVASSEVDAEESSSSDDSSLGY